MRLSLNPAIDRLRDFRTSRKERRARKRERIKTRSRPYRVLRGTGVFLLRSFVAVTAASLIFNAVSQPPEYLEATTGHTVKVGSADVHYEKWGGTGQAVVLLPGFAGSSVAYDYAGPKLAAKGYAVYAVDLPGFGYTRGGDARDIRRQADLVAGFSKKMGLDRPIVVGHSMGASVAGGVGLWHPQSTGGGIFADGDGLDIQVPRRIPGWMAKSPYITSLYRIGSRWTWLDQKIFKRSCGSTCTMFDGEKGKGFTKRITRPLTSKSAERTISDTMKEFTILHLTPKQIQSISVPSSIIWGSEDVSGGYLVRTRQNLGNPPERIIRGAGHQVMLSHPDEFASSVDSLTRQMLENKQPAQHSRS